jgi:hypothetical protein
LFGGGEGDSPGGRIDIIVARRSVAMTLRTVFFEPGG